MYNSPFYAVLFQKRKLRLVLGISICYQTKLHKDPREMIWYVTHVRSICCVLSDIQTPRTIPRYAVTKHIRLKNEGCRFEVFLVNTTRTVQYIPFHFYLSISFNVVENYLNFASETLVRMWLYIERKVVYKNENVFHE